MAEWIRLSTAIFKNRKMQAISEYPKGDSLAVFWIQLLCLAGEINDSGKVYITEGVPYSTKSLARYTMKTEALVKQALKIFTSLKMIDCNDDCIEILGWEKYQNVEGLERIRDNNKVRQRRFRFKKVGLEYEDDLKCAYCGKDAVTVDHIVPRSKGGADCPENAVPCCNSCNSTKSNKDLADFLNDLISYNADFEANRILSNPKLMAYVDCAVDNGILTFKQHSTNVINNVSKRINNTPITQENKNKNKSKNKKEKQEKEKSTENVVVVWERNISPITPILAEKLNALADEVGEAAILQGIDAAVEQNKRSFAYVQGCARNIAGGIAKGKAASGNDNDLLGDFLAGLSAKGGGEDGDDNG